MFYILRDTQKKISRSKGIPECISYNSLDVPNSYFISFRNNLKFRFANFCTFAL